MNVGETPEVTALYRGVERILNTPDNKGRKVGDSAGVYLFYDYDGEPIYVGQTYETLRSRIGRHLTGQRTDAVAKSVLDPFEVAEIKLWPFWDIDKKVKKTLSEEDKKDLTARHKEVLNRAEYTVYEKALRESKYKVILNEKPIEKKTIIPLPPSVRLKILEDDKERRKREHPDIRLARRARTIANLARVISERKVKIGIRVTLWRQARRLEKLAKKRVDSFSKKKK